MKNLSDFIEEKWYSKNYFDFTQLQDATPSERRKGCTYLLSDNMGQSDSKWKVAVYIKNTKEESLLKELCYNGGYMRFNGGEEIYGFGRCEVEGYGKTITLSDFEKMFEGEDKGLHTLHNYNH